MYKECVLNIPTIFNFRAVHMWIYKNVQKDAFIFAAVPQLSLKGFYQFNFSIYCTVESVHGRIFNW